MIVVTFPSGTYGNYRWNIRYEKGLTDKPLTYSVRVLVEAELQDVTKPTELEAFLFVGDDELDLSGYDDHLGSEGGYV